MAIYIEMPTPRGTVGIWFGENWDRQAVIDITFPDPPPDNPLNLPKSMQIIDAEYPKALHEMWRQLRDKTGLQVFLSDPSEDRHGKVTRLRTTYSHDSD